MVFAFVSLVGGYFLHQHFQAGDPKEFASWKDQMLPITIVLGWILLIAAFVLGFMKPDEEEES